MVSWWSSLNPFVEVHAEQEQEEDKPEDDKEESEEGEDKGMLNSPNSTVS
jgi:hypothetical protein